MFTFHLARNLVPATAESPKGPKSVYMWVCVCLCAFGGRGIKSVKSLSVLELKCSDRSVHWYSKGGGSERVTNTGQ